MTDPNDPRHGTNRGYTAGCRCIPCGHAHTVAMKLYRLGRSPRMVDATGTKRRIMALAAIGWPLTYQSRMAGHDEGAARVVMKSDRILAPRAAVFAALYERLSMVVPVDKAARAPGELRIHAKTRRAAAARGYAPPLAWDDIDTDLAPSGVRDWERQYRHDVNTWDDYDELAGEGYTRRQIADRLGISRQALDKALARRARADTAGLEVAS